MFLIILNHQIELCFYFLHQCSHILRKARQHLILGYEQ